MAIERIPERMTDVTIYVDDHSLVGTANSVVLPKIEFETTTVNATGLSGSYETPLDGYVKPMEGTIKVKTYTDELIKTFMDSSQEHRLTIRSSFQETNRTTGKKENVRHKVEIRGSFTSIPLGEWKKNADTENEVTFKASAFKYTIDDAVICDIDVLGYKCVIGDTDHLEETKKNLGLG